MPGMPHVKCFIRRRANVLLIHLVSVKGESERGGGNLSSITWHVMKCRGGCSNVLEMKALLSPMKHTVVVVWDVHFTWDLVILVLMI